MNLGETVTEDGWRVLHEEEEQRIGFEIARMSPEGNVNIFGCYLLAKEQQALVNFLNKGPAKKKQYQITRTFNERPSQVYCWESVHSLKPEDIKEV